MMAPFEGRSVLITGATGFIGRYLTRAILAAGGKVIAVSRRSDAEFDPQAIAEVCNLEDEAAIRVLVARHQPDFVYHLAAFVTANEDPKLVLPMMQGDLNSSVALLSALRGTNCRRVIQAGTCLEVDDGEVPTSPYGVAKACARLYALYYARQFATPVIHARLDMIYGPHQPRHRLIPYLINEHLEGRTPKLKTPDRRFGLLYIDDAVDALIECGTSPGLEGNTVEIGAGARLTVAEIAEIVERTMIEPLLPPDDIPLRSGCDNSAAWTWQPRISLMQGISATVDWHRNWNVNCNKTSAHEAP